MLWYVLEMVNMISGGAFGKQCMLVSMHGLMYGLMLASCHVLRN
jgi:hypothetical protein